MRRADRPACRANLYWALSALPRPFIGCRDQLEIERQLLENLIPELTEASLDPSRTAAEWASLMARMHGRIEEWSRVYSNNEKNDPALKALSTWGLVRFKTESLPAAREYLTTAMKRPRARIAAMSDDQVVAALSGWAA